MRFDKLNALRVVGPIRGDKYDEDFACSLFPLFLPSPLVREGKGRKAH